MGYPTKVQLISRQKGQQWYVNFPNALAEAMNLSLTRKPFSFDSKHRPSVVSRWPRFIPSPVAAT